jgi:hypothetical protein
MALTRFISWELWEVQSADPATCVGISLLLMAVALLAGLVPARRAVRVESDDRASIRIGGAARRRRL